METLSLDFNRLDREGRVRIGPEARKRLMPVLSRLVNADRVLVVDDEGNQCEGVLEDGSLFYPDTDAWLIDVVVRLDMATWKDGRSKDSPSTGVSWGGTR